MCRGLSVLVLVAAVGCGGGGGGGGLSAAELAFVQQNLEQCTSSRGVELFLFLSRLGDLVTALDSDRPESVIKFTLITEDPLGYEFELALDLDQDDVEDTIVSGTITAIERGARFLIDVGLSASDGSLTGNGEFELEVSGDSTFALSGRALLADITGDCSLDVTFEGLTLVVPPGPPPRLAAEFSGVELFGTMEATTRLGSDRMTATLVFPSGSNTVQASGVSVNGQNGSSFTFELPTGTPLPAVPAGVLVDCVLSRSRAFEAYLAATRELFAILEGRIGRSDSVERVEPGRNRNAFDFVLIFDGQRASGTIAFSEDPADGIARGATASMAAELERFGSTNLTFRFPTRDSTTVEGSFFTGGDCLVTLKTAGVGLEMTGTDLQGNLLVEASGGPNTDLNATLVLNRGTEASLQQVFFAGEVLDDVSFTPLG